MEFLPELLKFNDGSAVVCRNCWKRRRQEILRILSEEEYGITPGFSGEVSGEIIGEKREGFSGKAELYDLKISFRAEKGDFSFPVHVYQPVREGKCPVIVFFDFRPEGEYPMAREIVERGFALFVIGYNDVAPDSADKSSGLDSLYERRNDGTDWGKFGVWAFAGSRLLDYMESLPWADTGNAAVIGHSRLGKAALWCGAQDERFRFVISNDSGCTGAAYERGKHADAETVERITSVFPFWYCENFLKYAKRPAEMPMDQHFLLSLIAPRFLLVGSGSEDLWADPKGEEMGCEAVTPVYRLFDLPGYIGGDGFTAENEEHSEGTVAYHLRKGGHGLCREDWLSYLSFIEKHL